MAKESIITYADFNPPALLGLAKSLRQISRSCQPSETPLAESLNWIVILAFEDGVEWIFRSPRKDSAVGDEYSNLLLESEAANLKYIKDNTTILVPDVFDST